MADWYLAEGTGAAGPFSLDLLKQLASIGRLQRSDRVRQEGEPHWRTAESVPGLFPETAVAAAASLPPLQFRAVEVPSGPTAPRASYWLLDGIVPSGPFTRADLEKKVRSGAVGSEAKICEVGNGDWRFLSDVLFSEAKPGLPRPIATTPQGRISAGSAQIGAPDVSLPDWSPPTMAPADQTPKAVAGWHPVAVALLGILFSPLWAAVMAALNGERLGLKTPLLRPIGIAAGAFAADLILHRFSASGWISFALYFGSLLAIWSSDLAEQWEPYRSTRQTGAKSAAWGFPVLAGFILVGVCFAADDYLYPPGPRAVCERFAEASDIASRKAWCSESLWKALAPFGLNGPIEVELLDEAPAKAPLTGCFIGFRHPFVSQGQLVVMDGAFHLTRSGERWKIEEIYVTHDGFAPVVPPSPIGGRFAVQAPLGGVDPWNGVGAVPAKKALLPEKKSDAPAIPASRWIPIAGFLTKSKIPAVIGAAILGIVALLRRAASSLPTSSK
jgi:hypothetical protein